MSLPATSTHGPIRVKEDTTHFLVEIHPKDRDRAKLIPGRRWDGKRKAWVYEKTTQAYEALTSEFKRDAQEFDIRKPKSEPPATIEDPHLLNYFELVESMQDESEEPKRGADATNIQEELSGIRSIVEDVRDSFLGQEIILEEIREAQTELQEIAQTPPEQPAAPTSPQQPVEPIVREVEVLPASLDTTKKKHMRLLENTLKHLANSSSGHSASLQKWIDGHQPLMQPYQFVNQTNEYLKKQLRILLDEPDRTESFSDLLKQAHDQSLFFVDRDDLIRTESGLHILKNIRNKFGHPPPKFTREEQCNLSTKYLMTLALIWQQIETD